MSLQPRGEIQISKSTCMIYFSREAWFCTKVFVKTLYSNRFYSELVGCILTGRLEWSPFKPTKTEVHVYLRATLF